MHKEFVLPESGFNSGISSTSSSPKQQSHIPDLEQTMQSLAMSNGIVRRKYEDNGHPHLDGPQTSSSSSASSENDEEHHQPVKKNGIDSAGGQSQAKRNKAQMKKCLHLNLMSISNCRNDSVDAPAERVNSATLLSPWQQPKYHVGRVERPSKLFPVNILPNLYLGNDETAKNRDILKQCQVRYIINVTSDLPNYFENEDNVTYMRVPVDDNSSHDLAQYFPEAISFIEKAHSERAAVLVHCWAGISRSVTVCLAFLMYKLQCTLEKAFDLLLEQNGTIAPNFHFMEALTCWERDLMAAHFSSAAMGISTPPDSAKENGIVMINEGGNNSTALASPRSPSFVAVP